MLRIMRITIRISIICKAALSLSHSATSISIVIPHMFIASAPHSIVHGTDISVTYMFAVVGMYVLADVPGDNNIEEQLIQGQIYSMRYSASARSCQPRPSPCSHLSIICDWQAIQRCNDVLATADGGEQLEFHHVPQHRAHTGAEPPLDGALLLCLLCHLLHCACQHCHCTLLLLLPCGEREEPYSSATRLSLLLLLSQGVIIEAFCLDREEAEKQEKAAAAVKQHQQAQLDRARQGSTNGRGGGGGGGGMLHAHPGEVQLSPRSLQRQRRKTQFIKTDSEKVIGRFGDSNSSGSNSNSNGGIRMNQAARGGADAFHEALIGSPMPGTGLTLHRHHNPSSSLPSPPNRLSTAFNGTADRLWRRFWRWSWCR